MRIRKHVSSTYTAVLSHIRKALNASSDKTLSTFHCVISYLSVVNHPHVPGQAVS